MLALYACMSGLSHARLILAPLGLFDILLGRLCLHKQVSQNTTGSVGLYRLASNGRTDFHKSAYTSADIERQQKPLLSFG